MFVRIYSLWQVLGYIIYSVLLQLDLQFVEGFTLYMYFLYVQCVFLFRFIVNGRCYVIFFICVVCIFIQIYSLLEVLCYISYCVYFFLFLDSQFMIDFI